MSLAVAEPPTQPRLHARAITRLCWTFMSHHFPGGMTPAEREEARKAFAQLSALHLVGEPDDAVLDHYDEMIATKRAFEEDGLFYGGCGVVIEKAEMLPKKTAAE